VTVLHAREFPRAAAAPPASSTCGRPTRCSMRRPGRSWRDSASGAASVRRMTVTRSSDHGETLGELGWAELRPLACGRVVTKAATTSRARPARCCSAGPNRRCPRQRRASRSIPTGLSDAPGPLRPASIERSELGLGDFRARFHLRVARCVRPGGSPRVAASDFSSAFPTACFAASKPSQRTAPNSRIGSSARKTTTASSRT
jgi:hypothetical protein